jgi:hypothetical protein
MLKATYATITSANFWCGVIITVFVISLINGGHWG